MNDELQKQIDALRKDVDKIRKDPPLPEHLHNGFDSTRVNYSDIYQKKLYIHHTIQGISAATAGYYGVFYVIPAACVLTGFKEVHQTLGTDAGAVTLQLEKLTGTQALDAGVAMLATALSLKATVNSVQTATLTGTLADRSLVAGDRLALDDSGTLTAVANVTVMVELTLN